jgi:hypothetical protein
MTHAEIRERLQRGRGPISWGELSDLVLAGIWYRMLAYRTAKGLPMPPDDLRPRLVDAPGRAA